MKLSKSKLALAKVINENGGWVDGSMQLATSNKNGSVYLWSNTPRRIRHVWDFGGKFTYFSGAWCGLQNWHQTILSREEYYNAYPNADADGWIEWNGGGCPVDDDAMVEVKLRNPPLKNLKRVRRACEFDWRFDGMDDGEIIAYRLHKPQVKPESCESVMRSIPEQDKISELAGIMGCNADMESIIEVAKSNEDWIKQLVGRSTSKNPESKPTIERLAQDYRNAKDYADRLQKEADDAAMAAKYKLRDIKKSMKELGFKVKYEKTDRFFEFLVGDIVSWKIVPKKEFKVISVHHDETREVGDFEIEGEGGGVFRCYSNEIKLIRRP